MQHAHTQTTSISQCQQMVSNGGPSLDGVDSEEHPLCDTFSFPIGPWQKTLLVGLGWNGPERQPSAFSSAAPETGHAVLMI